ncbi:MAG: LysR family transcriptional regulator [Gammaproteobacteria bacterium]|nr:LysR family transcriptional regulator [Gammaproteobacteria bacterium]
MSQHNTDLNLFKVFVAIYQQRNLTRAAELLSVTQPAVSNALNRLRNSFDDKLFIRTHKGMVPTPFAESIIERVQEALQILNSSLISKETFDPSTSRRIFRISMNDLTEEKLLPRLIQELQKRAPGIELDCFHVKRANIESEMSKGMLDLALDATISVGSNQLNSQSHEGSRFVCMLSKNHSSIHGNSISLKEYLGLNHIVVSNRRRGLSYEDTVLKQLGLKRNIALRISHYLVAPLVVKHSDLALTIPESLAERHDNKILELPYEIKPLGWRLYWHKSTEDDSANKWIRGLVAELAIDL